MRKLALLGLIGALALSQAMPAGAGLEHFNDGPLIKGYGKHAPVERSFNHQWVSSLMVAFDVGSAAHGEGINNGFDSLARFLNMHAAAGTDMDKMRLALVVHGKSTLDLLKPEAYRARFGRDNANAGLIEALLANHVRVILCGQSAAYLDVANDELLPGVDVALSAMTAHAVLDQLGFSSNPF